MSLPVRMRSASRYFRDVFSITSGGSFGPGAEIISRLMEKAFFYLEAPIARVTGYDVVIPLFSKETFYLPNAQRIMRAAREVLGA